MTVGRISQEAVEVQLEVVPKARLIRIHLAGAALRGRGELGGLPPRLV